MEYPSENAHRFVIGIDIILAVIVSIWLVRSNHTSWWLVGLVAYSPDVFWIYRYVFEEKFGRLPHSKGNRFIQFHRNIQKYERWWGCFVEIIYAAGMILLIK